MTDYRLDIAGPHSDAYTRYVADALAESVRVLNHATQLPADTRDPATVHHVLGSLHDAVARMDQLLDQLTRRLADLHAAGRIAHDNGNPDSAAHAVSSATGSISHARTVIASVSGNLAAAHAATSGLHLRDESETR